MQNRRRDMRRKWKMRLKLLVFCLGCTLTGLLLQTWLFQTSTSKLIYNQAEEESSRTMRNMQDSVNNVIKDISNNLLGIYKEADLITDLRRKTDISILKEKYNRTAANLEKEFDSSLAVLAVYLYNSQHEIISTYRKAMTPKHNYPVDIYLNSSANNAQMVKDYISSEENQMMISSYYNAYREKDIIRFVMKIFSYQNTDPRIGYVVCDIDSKVFEKIIKKYRIDEDMFIWFQPMGDRPIVSMGNLDSNAQEEYERISEGILLGNTDIIELQSKKRVLFSAEQDKYNLTAYSLMPRNLLRKTQEIMTDNLILITLIMLIAVSVSLIFFSQILTGPLEEMTETVKRIGSGETHLRIEKIKDDEVGELGENFNAMLDRLEDLIASEYESKLLVNRAEYQALQAQINPHFLYNTLDTMSSIAEIQECPQVSTLCHSLAGMFRYSLNMKKTLSTVAQEIIHLKNYIYVMDVRMNNQIEYIFQIDENTLQDTLPRISIQPLVENAINHGLKNQKGEKKIWIRTENLGNHLIISVEDNGIGMSKDRIREVFSEKYENQEDQRTSIGITNIHRRMKLLYGEESGLQVESTLGHGTIVKFCIPRKKQEENELWR